MYFLPRNNAFYSRIVYLKPLHRYAFTGILSVALICIWFLTIHHALELKIVHAQDELKNLHQQERMIKQSTLDINQLKTSIADMQAKLSSLSKKDANLQSAMMALINQAGGCGLAMQSCTLAEPKDESWYVRNTVNMDVSGSFDQLLKFVQSLSTSQHLLAMHQATLTRSTVVNKFNLRCGMDVIIIK